MNTYLGKTTLSMLYITIIIYIYIVNTGIGITTVATYYIANCKRNLVTWWCNAAAGYDQANENVFKDHDF